MRAKIEQRIKDLEQLRDWVKQAQNLGIVEGYDEKDLAFEINQAIICLREALSICGR